MRSSSGGTGQGCPHKSQNLEQNVWKNLYLLVSIFAGSVEEVCAEDYMCCAVLPPTLSVLDEASDSGVA